MNHTLIRKYIEGSATPDEKRQVMEWVNESSAHEIELKQVRKVYDVALWNAVDSERVYVSKYRRSWMAGVAAVIALFACAASIYFYQRASVPPPDPVMQTIQVPPGQRVLLTLVDETQVWLNAGSSLIFPNRFGDTKREVILDGEGYFCVAKDAKHPFVVRTATYEVTALGTEFNVMAYDKSKLFDVALLEGVVTVGRADGSSVYRMQPNERLIATGGALETDSISNFDFLLWKDGIISLDDEPVEDMIRKIELYYDVQIVVQNEAFARRRYTGKFRTKDGVEHILKVFQLNNDFCYTKDDENNIITIR
ncbi:MAG: DUF4974 domain-containing protein [Prevotellaceae bacterium]|jgi:ferric-dicitrate binding protein FerR (iron transport regulator)|nr:DUF4974 domain-containing protein [Prevotellaceae bacterium]